MKVLIVNHKEKQCGIHQYGVDIYEALKKSQLYDFTYTECSNAYELKRAVTDLSPGVIIYNYYPFTMPWLTSDVTKWYNDTVQMGVMQEVTQEAADNATNNLFDYHLCPDPTLRETPLCLKIPRLLPTYNNTTHLPNVPTIGSFGFGYRGKGFDRVVDAVIKEFDNAIINLHIPNSDIIGKHFWSKDNPWRLKRDLIKHVNKTGIRLRISSDFLNKQQLLDFLAGNTINCFFYDVEKYLGISSAVDSALAVHRPIALTRSMMFRHVWDAPVFIEESSLREIIARGTVPLEPYYRAWSEESFIHAVEEVISNHFP